MFEALKTGNIALKQAQAEAGVEQFEELAGDLEVRINLIVGSIGRLD